MLFLKSTSVSKASGIYEVDIAAKPPGKTFGIFLATDPDHPPHALLGQLKVLGYENTYSSPYLHKDGGKVLDLHFQKDGTDIFKGWKTEECTLNLAAITVLFEEHGIAIAPRVMSMAEAYA
ncbi:MAG: hypothetical protein I8H79_09030 [Burkholderiales bacterium]|nr:hypothetical protein [Burkholderiales bacterium]MBH1993596.1 hypothetical protein [Burkholderiales bacterium]MBH2068509.1 hypothetical protein [Burkholderiales bacterium]